VPVLEWEELLASMLHELPQPVSQETTLDGRTVLVAGDPGEVVVQLTRTSASVAEFAVDWEGPNDPVTRPIQFGRILWRRFEGVDALAVLRALVAACRGSRRAKYRTCRMCETLRPPESMHDEEVCQACAQKHLGIVY
jgi:hypothetical protein